MNQIFTINTIKELAVFAEVLIAALRTKKATLSGAVVVALSGDLGAGKTTLVQFLAKSLGVTDVVTSPTFTIMKGYETKDTAFNRLVHMDAYRIESLDELRPLHVAEIFSADKTLFCIEWAEKIAAALPADIVTLDIKTSGEVRQITLTGLSLPV